MEYLCIPTGEWAHADDLDHLLQAHSMCDIAHTMTHIVKTKYLGSEFMGRATATVTYMLDKSMLVSGS